MNNPYTRLFFLLLSQFTGGPGPKENNLVRFGLPAILWAVLFGIAWSRTRRESLPRERMLLLGFALAFIREAFMFLHTIEFVLRDMTGHPLEQCLSQPFEHALAMAAILVVIASFLRYLLDDEGLARRYLYGGLAVTGISYLFNWWWWPRYSAAHPIAKFHQAWAGVLVHYLTAILIFIAIVLMFKKRGWLRNVVVLALVFYLLGEVITSLNAFTGEAYKAFICPIANLCHMLAPPVFGVVYLREQAIEKQVAEAQLRAYRDHLADLVEARTAELTVANKHLQREVAERKQAEEALAELGHRNELILNSAGEGIFGVDLEGRHTFVNLAAATMLGYEEGEMIGLPSHATWHHSYPDGSPYPEKDCPLHNGYKIGLIRRGTDQVFWRKNGSGFPVEYMSTPIIEEEDYKGAVVVFKDITERKQAEAEIARRNAELAAQNRIAATVSQSLELDTILNTALNTVSGILDMNVGCIFLYDAETEELMSRVCRVGSALDTFRGTAVTFSLEQQISARAIAEMRPVVLGAADFAEFQSVTIVAGETLEILLSIPLMAKGKVLGALTLGSARAETVPAQSLELLTAIGQQIGMAVENANLYQQAEMAATLEERQRIASEMHDGLAQTISYLGHKVDETVDLLEDGALPQVFAICQEIRGALDRASRDVRLSIASLRESPRPRRSLQKELADLIATLQRDPGPQVDFVDTLPAPLYAPPLHLEQILRVASESLLNVYHHADARYVTVCLERDSEEMQVKLRVVDDGKGFNPELPHKDGRDHFGLSIMRARAGRIEGRLDIVSALGQGTTVALTWPVAAS